MGNPRELRDRSLWLEIYLAFERLGKVVLLLAFM